MTSKTSIARNDIQKLRLPVTVIAGSTGNLHIIRCPIRPGMTSINEFSEFRTDDEFLMIALLYPSHDLRIYAETL